MKRHFFRRGQYLGSTEVGNRVPDFINGEMIGYAYFCPICAEVWAMALVEGKGTFPAAHFCERHTVGDRCGFTAIGHVSEWDVPGSMFIPGRDDYNSTFPPAVWEQEVIIHLAHAIRYSLFDPPIASIAQDVISLLLTRMK